MLNEIISWIDHFFTNGMLGLLTIVAILVAPWTALWLQKKIERSNEEKQRKLGIFKTLLATRANVVSIDHVQALNMIEVEFYKEKTVRDSWNIYRDHLNSYPFNKDKQTQERWEECRSEFLTDLLYVMSKLFGYDFDKVLIKKGAYSPIVHNEEAILRQLLANVLAGVVPIKVEIVDKQDHLPEKF